jgi:transcriptional regulator with XRE-family HTH domain
MNGRGKIIFLDRSILKRLVRKSREMKKIVPDGYKAEVGGRVRLLREALGKKQGELAAEVAVEANTWNQYENGVSLAPAIVMRRWKRLDARVSLDYIYDGDASRLFQGVARRIEEIEAERAAGASKPSVARRSKQKAAK